MGSSTNAVMKLVPAADHVAAVTSAAPEEPRRRKEAPLTVLARVAPHLAAAFDDSTGRLDRFDRRFGDAALATFARSLDKAAAADLETFLRQAHDLYRDRKRLADAGLVLGRLPVADAGRIYTALADAVVTAVLRACEAEFVARHGRVAAGRHALVALGTFGSRTPTATSDLDLMFVYEVDDPAACSDGAHPLAADHYYCRLAQYVVAALGADFGHGPMFEVDVRLRPWGVEGPVATRLTSLRHYFAGEAWTFEAMALTRARVIAGGEGFIAEVAAALRQAVVATAQLRDVGNDVSFMRELVQEVAATSRIWDVKDVAGGLMDIDFVVQGLILKNTPVFAKKPINDCARAIAVLRRAKALPAADARVLLDALRLYGAVSQFMKLAAHAEPRHMPAEFAAMMATAAGADDIRALERDLRRTQREVARVFAAIYGKTRRRDWIHRVAA